MLKKVDLTVDGAPVSTPMLATGTTAIRYKSVFRRDLLADIGAMDKSGTLDYVTIARLAYVMAMQAAHTDMSTCSDDTFMDWLDTLDGDAILTAAREIIGAYLSSRATTVAPKNAVAQ